MRGGAGYERRRARDVPSEGRRVRRDGLLYGSAANDAVQLRASEAKRVSCNRGLYGRAERAERETEAVEDSL